MKFKTQVADCIVGFVLLMLCIVPAQATCPGATVQSSNYCLFQPGFSTLAHGVGMADGNLKTVNYQLLAGNMYPYQAQSSASELSYWREKAITGLKAGKDYRDSLPLIGVNPLDGSDPRSKMLNDPTLNYGTAGLLTNFPANEAALLQARDTFAYQLYRNYPDAATARANLLDAIKTLANLYLMIADEYLIDALEWRFPLGTVGVDPMLDSQIALLNKAQSYYDKALNAFISGFSTAVGTNITIADSFDDDVYSLFNLSVERMSLTLRELSSKQWVRTMAPGSTISKASSDILKVASTASYLTTAAIAKKRGLNFDDAGAGSGLITALNALRRQGNLQILGLNPLGYDSRYIPALDYESLYTQAEKAVIPPFGAKTKEDNFKAVQRDFDYDVTKLKNELDRLTSRYVDNLWAMTLCTRPVTSDKEPFITCTGEAGGDLLVCGMDFSSTDFDACLSTKTGGVLRSKYRNWHETHISLTLAKAKKNNILQKIDNINEANARHIEIIRSTTNASRTSLTNYLNSMKSAVTITETETTTTTRTKKGGKWVTEPKTRKGTTEKQFNLRNDALDIQATKEQEGLQITADFQIQTTDADTALTVKNLLLEAAEADIAVEMAVAQKNSAGEDFDTALKQKDDTWLQYQTDLEQLDQITSNLPPLRVLRSQAAIDLADAMNTAAHYTYLAAKALEYKYAKALEEMPNINGQTVSVINIFKAQTPTDLGDFLQAIDQLNTTQCTWGKIFIPRVVKISLMKDVKGIKNPDSIDKVEAKAFFISNSRNVDGTQGNLKFDFAVSEAAKFLNYFNSYNMKIWSGSPPPGCGFFSGLNGVAVVLKSEQALANDPFVLLRQSGHSTVRDSHLQFREYIIVTDSNFLLTQSNQDYQPSTDGYFFAFQQQVSFDDPFAIYNNWTPVFKGKGISSSNWEIQVYNQEGIDFSKVYDMEFYFSTIRQDN